MIEVSVNESTDVISVETEQTGEAQVTVDGTIYYYGAGGDYNALENLPSINGIVIQGAKNASDYGLQSELVFCTSTDIDGLFE